MFKFIFVSNCYCNAPKDEEKKSFKLELMYLKPSFLYEYSNVNVTVIYFEKQIPNRLFKYVIWEYRDIIAFNDIIYIDF